ncbi:MAG: hypothetical protein M1828_004535 [Chrysothrix sp. TS-e1954]|nr:MAG: hypothetical protein M1828_004535 [Chrysothrix sp. TS-e1954]
MESLGARPTFTVILNPSQSFKGTSQEKRAFDHFYHRTTHALSGSFDSGFWADLLLRAVQTEPAIRHAALAVSSLHERYSVRQPDNSLALDGDTFLSWFPLEQYGKAMQLISQPRRKGLSQSRDVILTVCILFICLESMQGNIETALIHVQNGLKVLDELRQHDQKLDTSSSSTANSTLVSTSILETLFTRLDIQAAGLVDAGPGGPRLMHPTPPPPPSVPIAFKTLEDARAALLKKQCFFGYRVREIVLSHNNPDEPTIPDAARQVTSLQKDFLKYLDAWDGAKRRCVELQFADKRTRIASKILDLHRDLYTTSTLKFSGSCVQDPSDKILMPDEPLDDRPERFTRMVQTAEKIHKMELEDPRMHNSGNGEHTPTLAFDLGLTEPMFYTTMACEDQDLRQRALKLLEASSILEGLWGSTVAAQMARTMMKFQSNYEGEDALGTLYTCNTQAARIKNIEINFHHGQTATLKYFQTDGAVFTDQISTRVKSQVAIA